MLLNISTPQHLRGKHCMFYSITFTVIISSYFADYNFNSYKLDKLLQCIVIQQPESLDSHKDWRQGNKICLPALLKFTLTRNILFVYIQKTWGVNTANCGFIGVMSQNIFPWKKAWKIPQNNGPPDGNKIKQHIYEHLSSFSKMHSCLAGDFGASNLFNHLLVHTPLATNATENCFKVNGRNPEDRWNCVCLK